ncbi:hypothetical protein KEM55_002936 [Ascosphaera atra]|nr:hypothetical protein KEM55_002936 [Ascosphaera atra]
MADETAIFSDSTSSDHGDPTVIPRTVFQTKEEGNVISHNGPPTRESQCTPRGYPDGPICIYDEGLYLYLEPEIEDVSSFDVIVNVAQEVPNPFSKVDVKKEEKVGSTKKPQEYVHVPWGHNSEILDDLYPLCRFIESRLSRSQRVLIHCQLGVSRSASLVIAYGLYKNPDKDFNEMYRIVKERSEWVGPNLGLIYQLVDFKGQVARGGDDSTGDLPHSWFERCEPTQETTGLKVQSVANPSLLAVPATDRPSESPLSPSAREPLSPSFIKTTFFADDDSVPKQRATSGPILSSPSKSSNTFADLLSQRRRSSFTPRPLPLREKFEKPQLDAKPPPTPTTATTATTNDNHKFPKLAPPPSFSVIARAEHKANMPPIAHVLKQDTSATLGSAFEMPEPRCSFGQTPNQRQQQQQEEKQTGQEAKILASPRTREFTQMQLPALSTIQARRASVKLASLQSGPVQPQLSRPKTATFPEAGMPLSDDPRSPPPRPSISAGGYRRRSKASDYAQQFQMDLQQHMQRIQSCKARAEPTVMMQSIDDVL